MRKLIVVLTLVCCTSIAFSQKAFDKKVLKVHNKSFTGSRIQLLASQKTILMQPRERNFVLLNEDGAGGELGGFDDRSLYVQDSTTKQWLLIANTASVGGDVIEGVFDSGIDITIFVRSKKVCREEPRRVFIQKPSHEVSTVF